VIERNSRIDVNAELPRGPRILPRVTESTHAALSAYAAAHDCFLSDAIEAAAQALAVRAADLRGSAGQFGYQSATKHWGGNYFPLPPHRGFIFWDKVNDLPNAGCLVHAIRAMRRRTRRMQGNIFMLW
jgi:hypothetical protein